MTPPDWSYCGDHKDDWGIVYIQGKNGLFANMDIDCDGQSLQPNSGRCGHNPTDQSVTAMRDALQAYQVAGVSDLNTYVHPYVVFGNSGTNPHNVVFDPQSTCGIWGDTNGGERDASFVGEASLAAGELTFGVGAVNGTTSHDPNDVLYIAMTGAAAVPGKTGASWNATTKEQFAASINAQCLKVAARVQPDAACSWAGHCAGASCSSNDDCGDSLVCTGGKCGKKSKSRRFGSRDGHFFG
ncbi:chitosanase precursor [Pestalotiopsis sp. NC0098]|nr:chitosanase precursor [Pestalotiopsis sp. NC0098]